MMPPNKIWRLFIPAACLAMCGQIFAEWEPPAKPDPQAILDEAQTDAREGRYEDALAKHLWFHRHALEYERALYGVRLSFALGYWFELGQEYPPAMEKLKRVRDQSRIRVITGKKDIRELFHDLSSINDYLGDQKQTAEVFLRLDKNSPKLAASVYDVAEEDLIRAKKYKVCSKYLTPEKTVERMLQIYGLNQKYAEDKSPEEKEMHLRFSENHLTESSGSLIALLVLNDRKAEAEKVAARIKKEAPSKTREKAIDAALQGKFPEAEE